MTRVLVLFVALASSALAYVHKPIGAMTCTIENTAKLLWVYSRFYI